MTIKREIIAHYKELLFVLENIDTEGVGGKKVGEILRHFL